MLWALLPWEACLLAGLLFWHVARLCSRGVRYPLRAAVIMVVGLMIGLGLPVFLHMPEVWALPLFATGAGLSAVATLRSPMSRQAPRGGMWARLSRGAWLLCVGFYLMYGANQYASLHAAGGAARALALALSALAALHFTAALISYSRGQRAWATESRDTKSRDVVRRNAERDDAREMDPGDSGVDGSYPSGEPYPFDYPTIASATSHATGGSAVRERRSR